ncbi:hypothetical protein L6452_36568 [Arctium lappa]|uniref:Uncharacterized protein n=1 Tax=Arctium lappa TaxID=4217 RepID=A0ACB8YA65_ARCLA|nr:hypothetical protein L6452_36568 [Arctium lappa]
MGNLRLGDRRNFEDRKVVVKDSMFIQSTVRYFEPYIRVVTVCYEKDSDSLKWDVIGFVHGARLGTRTIILHLHRTENLTGHQGQLTWDDTCEEVVGTPGCDIGRCHAINVVLVENSPSDTVQRGVLVLCSRNGYLSEVFRTRFGKSNLCLRINMVKIHQIWKPVSPRASCTYINLPFIAAYSVRRRRHLHRQTAP